MLIQQKQNPTVSWLGKESFRVRVRALVRTRKDSESISLLTFVGLLVDLEN